MSKKYIIFTNEELDKLNTGHPVRMDEGDGDVTLFYSEEGWKKHLKRWVEE